MHATAYRYSGSARIGRGVLMGTTVLLLTVMGHTAEDRWTSMDTASLVLLWPLAVALSLAAADRRRSAGFLFAFVLGTQALFHVLMSIASGHAPHAAPLLPSAAMLLGHLVAGAATAFILAQGDRLMHVWLAFWAVFARGRVTSLVLPPMPRAIPPRYVAPVLHRRASRTAISRRGPPASSV